MPKAKKGKKRKGAKNKEEDAEKQVRLDNVAGQEAAPAAAASGAAAEENKVDNTSSAVPTVVQPTKTNSIVGQPVYKIIQSSSPISAIHEYCKKGEVYS